MSQIKNSDPILAQDSLPTDVNDLLGIGQPISLSEIEDLLYNDSFPAQQRLEQLRRFRDEMRSRAGSEVGGNDPQAMLVDIERAIRRLEGAREEEEDEVYALDETMLDVDPLAHSETLSPDDDDLIDAQAREEESVADEDEERSGR